jgi:FemAB-related protein (PEP-CTERM system-associated)
VGLHVIGLEQVKREWDAFVGASDVACLYHDARWKEVIGETFGHRCHYLAAREACTLQGVLPLVEIRSLLFGRFLVSLPFVTYGGLAATSPQAASALAEAAVQLARQLGASHVELRQRCDVPLSWPARRHKVGLTVRLPAQLEDAWTALSSRLRGKIRKARRSGAAFCVFGPEGAAGFYSVFCRNMRDLGTPVYPFRLFLNIGRRFGPAVRVFQVLLHGRPVAAAFGLQDRCVIRLPWICSDYRSAKTYVNEFLYWSVIEWASRHGFTAVDLGRSTAGGGNYRFKKQFNAEEEPAPWYFWAPEGRRPRELSPDNPRFRWAIRLWSRLPLAVTNTVGPLLVRSLP